MSKLTQDEIHQARREAESERKIEWEAVKERFPIPPNATQEEITQITLKRNAAMLDP